MFVFDVIHEVGVVGTAQDNHLVQQEANVGYTAGDCFVPSSGLLLVSLVLLRRQLRSDDLRMVQCRYDITVAGEMGAKKRSAAPVKGAGMGKDYKRVIPAFGGDIAHCGLTSLLITVWHRKGVLRLKGKILTCMCHCCGIPDFAVEEPVTATIERLDSTHADWETASLERIVSGVR